jgi:glutamate racemase
VPITIGVYDSGIGGLSVLKELILSFPHHNFIYFADTARMPYGQKKPEELCKYAYQTLSWMKTSLSVQAVVSACHTSSVNASAVLNADWGIPVIGMYEALKQLLEERLDLSCFTLFATPATVQQSAYFNLFQEMNRKILCIPCPGLVEEIEKPLVKQDLQRLQRLVHEFVQNKMQKSQAIIYGCTHYPFIDSLFQHALSDSIERINPATLVVQSVKRKLQRVSDSLTLEKKERKLTFYTSGCPHLFSHHLKEKGICKQPLVFQHQF